MTNEEIQEIIDRAEDEYDRLKDRVHEQYHEIEILNTNLEVAKEDLTRIAQLLGLEEGCTIYDIEDKIERLNNIIKEAINYIDDNTYYKDHKGHINIDDLYIILQGSDKE